MVILTATNRQVGPPQTHDSQLIAQLVLLLLHVSAANRCHLQGAMSVEDMSSLLYGLSNINGQHISLNWVAAFVLSSFSLVFFEL